MPKIPLINNGIGALSASTTRFGFLGMNPLGGFFSVEGQTQVPMTVAGTFSDFFVYVTANAATTTTTIVIRKNAADTIALISIGAGLTGKFKVTASVSVLPGDLMNVSQTNGATGSTNTTTVGVSWTPLTRFQSPAVASNGTNFATDSTTIYFPISGNKGGNAGVQAAVQYKLYSPGTFHGLSAYVQTNTRSTTTTIGFEINGATVITISVGAGLTGLFRDNTTRAVAGMYSLINYNQTTSTGGGNFSAFMMKIDYVPNNRQDFILFWGTAGSVTTAAGLTRYFMPGGQTAGDATEANRQPAALSKITLRYLRIYVSANTMIDDSTLKSRKNTGYGNFTITIGTLVTGVLEATSGVYDTFLPTDLLDWELITGATGTSLVMTQISCLGSVAPYPKFFQ